MPLYLHGTVLQLQTKKPASKILSPGEFLHSFRLKSPSRPLASRAGGAVASVHAAGAVPYVNLTSLLNQPTQNVTKCFEMFQNVSKCFCRHFGQIVIFVSILLQ